MFLTHVRHLPHNVHMTEQTLAKQFVPPVTMGWRIKMALDHAELKSSDLEEKFEVSRGTVSRWCRDVGPVPKKFILNEIAVMCGVSARWLIDGKNPHPDGPDGGHMLPRLDSNQQPSVKKSF